MNEKIELKRALLVGINVNNDKDFEKSFEELEDLAKANYYEPVCQVSQNVPHVNKAIFLGTGKLEEIREIIKKEDIEIVVFNNELSPMQYKNISDALKIEIIDRTGLILQIFSDRAKTREAKLQVEVARLGYMLPRLSHMHTGLSRQGAGKGSKGSGEKKLELDKRVIEKELDKLKKDLEGLSKVRETQRKKRAKSGLSRIALAGYTNAGKSTILNEILKLYECEEVEDDEESKIKTVFEKDMLFATLETSVRKIKLDNNKSFLLSDTVGFIRQLPHSLVKAFRSTLEEIKESDLILEVIDMSDEDYEKHMEVTEKTINDIGAGDVPVLYVFNKADKCDAKHPEVKENEIYISAKSEDDVKCLIEEISKRIFSSYVKCKMLIPFDKGNIVSYLNSTATIYNTEYNENGTLLDLELNEADYNKYLCYEIK
ncbi:MAG: GTPase HflX [Clostridia bacterium]|nr:GTPase HflX [Clostridia bacterium]